MSMRFKLQSVWRILAFLLIPIATSCSGDKTPKQSDKKTAPSKWHPGLIEVPDKTIDEYTEAIARDPLEVNERGELAYQRRGAVYAAQGEHEKAIADFSEALRLYPQAKHQLAAFHDSELRDLRATSYMMTKEYDKAVADYSRILDYFNGIIIRDPDEKARAASKSGDLYYRRAQCYDAMGESAKALADFKEAVRLKPSLLNDDLRQRLAK